MDIINDLKQYTEYSKGDISKKCKLEYEDISIKEVDFSKYDLNNSFFLGVKFLNCNFDNVYLSDSNFGGSIIDGCEFRNNVLKKASWDDMRFEKVNVKLLEAFRTTFLYGMFIDTNFEECNFEKCSFSESMLKNVYFTGCTISDTDFRNCKFKNVHFRKCKFINVKFDENLNGQAVFFDR